MTHKPAHKPAGIPEGGQFAATSHAEPALSLTVESRFDAEAHAELNTAIRTETARVEEAKRKLSRMHLDAAAAIVRKDFPDAAGLELDFTSSTGMTAKAVRDRDGNVLSEGTSWIYSSPGDGSYLCSHLDAVQQSLFYNGAEGFRYEDETGALIVDLDHRFSAPAPPAPVLGGFTAAEVEDYLAREQHDRQCGCHLPDEVCCTPSYGENWRHRMGVPDVEGIFETIQEMAGEKP